MNHKDNHLKHRKQKLFKAFAFEKLIQFQEKYIPAFNGQFKIHPYSYRDQISNASI
jgi:hypothetical protein